MLTAYDNFHTGIAAMKTAPSPQGFCTAEETREKYLWIRKYLNIHELVAVGISEGVLDEDVCYSYWGDTLVNGYADATPVLDFLRTRHKNQYTYSDLGTLNAKWKARKAKASSLK